MSRSIRLYRALIAAAADLPVAPLQRKVKRNIRDLFDLYKSVQSDVQIAELHQDAEAAIEVIRWLNNLPEVNAGNAKSHAKASALHLPRA